jgi:DNA polymerase III psi subunit
LLLTYLYLTPRILEMTKAKLEHLLVKLNIEDDSDGSDHEVETSFVDEFHALAKVRGWKIGSKAWKKNWEVYTQAENERLSNNHDARLERWKQMCVKLRVKPATSIGQCRKVRPTPFLQRLSVYRLIKPS